jgi:DNA-binding CsgD family transcriptional regulator
MTRSDEAGSAFALFEQSGFGFAVANAAQLVTFAAGKLAELLPVGAPMCESFAPLRGMERKIASLPREKGDAKITIASFAVVKDTSVSEKSSLLIAWDDDAKAYTICFYPSHDEAEKKLVATLRLKRISEEIMRAGGGCGIENGGAYRQGHRSQKPVRIVDKLTAREREVVSLLASGQTNKGVARILGLSAKTVEAHRARALKRLNVKTTAELIRIAIEGGLGQSER